MNWLDIVLIVIVVASTVFGFISGIVKVAVHFVALLLAIILSSLFYKQAGAAISGMFGGAMLANLFGFLGIFVGVLIIGSILTWAIQKLFDVTGLRFIDRLLGGVFGLVRAAVAAAVLVMLVNTFSRTSPSQTIVESQFAPYLLDAGRIMMILTPKEARDSFDNNYRLTKSLWARAIHKINDPESSSTRAR